MVSNNTAEYVIAVKREARKQAPRDWQARIREIDTVEMIGEPRPRRLLIRANQTAIEKIHDILGSCCHIEPVIRHEKY